MRGALDDSNGTEMAPTFPVRDLVPSMKHSRLGNRVVRHRIRMARYLRSLVALFEKLCDVFTERENSSAKRS